MLPFWQKPEDSFMAPTYLVKGGSDFSHSRQGGVFILILKLLAMVYVISRKRCADKGQRSSGCLYPAYLSGFFIDSCNDHSPPLIRLSFPEILLTP